LDGVLSLPWFRLQDPEWPLIAQIYAIKGATWAQRPAWALNAAQGCHIVNETRS
jgi:hypothetical protein